MLIIVVLCIFGGITAWRYLEYFLGELGWSKTFLPILVGGIGCLWLLLMIISLTNTKLGRKLGKLWKIEEKNRDKAFKATVKSGKEIVLVVKRRIAANLSLILGIMLLWAVLLFIPNLSQIELIIILPLSVAWALYGFIFSFFFHKKFVVWSGSNFLINIDGEVLNLNVGEIKNTRLIKNPKHEKAHPSKGLAVMLLSDIEIELIDGRKLIFKKTDRAWNYGHKIRVIQKTYKNKQFD